MSHDAFRKALEGMRSGANPGVNMDMWNWVSAEYINLSREHIAHLGEHVKLLKEKHSGDLKLERLLRDSQDDRARSRHEEQVRAAVDAAVSKEGARMVTLMDAKEAGWRNERAERAATVDRLRAQVTDLDKRLKNARRKQVGP